MATRRSRRVSGRDAIVLAAIVAGLLALVLGGAFGSASDPGGPAATRFVSYRFGFAAPLPAGWRRATGRLVPKLLGPREILSLGTFAMAAGGGGNCGREPVAAIERMKPGDALLSIQEYALSPGARGRLARTLPSLSTYSSPAMLELRRELRPRGEHVPAAKSLWSATLPFRDHGRVFDALVYVKGTPSRDRLGQVVSILSGLSFRRGTYVHPPRSTGTAGAGPFGPPPRADRIVSTARLRGAILRGAEADFRGAKGAGAVRFRTCLLGGLRAALTPAALAKLALVYERPGGQQFAAQALNRLAVPTGDRCGGRRFVPELIDASRALRVGLDLVLKRTATAVAGVVAVLAGHRMRLRTPGLHSGVRGLDWVGSLRNAGLERKGSPLYVPRNGRGTGVWAGSPPVYAPIRIRVTYADGHLRSRLFPRVFLSPGWG